MLTLKWRQIPPLKGVKGDVIKETIHEIIQTFFLFLKKIKFPKKISKKTCNLAYLVIANLQGEAIHIRNL